VQITTTELPDGIVNLAYSQKLTAADGAAPLTWRVTAGTLPDGPDGMPEQNLRLNSNTGVISGTPGAPGTWTFTVEVTDSDVPPTSDSEEFTIEVKGIIGEIEG
jgi:hypothetical protein